jgi:hypothetical protein
MVTNEWGRRTAEGSGLITTDRVVWRRKQSITYAWSTSLAARSSSLTLQATTQTVPTRPPRVGELVLVRSRRWLVDEVIEAKNRRQGLEIRQEECRDRVQSI